MTRAPGANLVVSFACATASSYWTVGWSVAAEAPAAGWPAGATAPTVPTGANPARTNMPAMIANARGR